MELERIPRGRENPRPIDADPIPDPHGQGEEYTRGLTAEAEAPEAERPAAVAVDAPGVPVAVEPPAANDAPAEPLPGTAHAAAASRPAEPDAPPPTHAEFRQATPEDTVDSEWIGWKATDEMGRGVGRIEGALEPEWIIVRDRRGRHLLAPAAGAIAGGSAVFLPYPHDVISSAPQLRGSDGLDPETATAARAHYSGHSPVR